MLDPGRRIGRWLAFISLALSILALVLVTTTGTAHAAPARRSVVPHRPVCLIDWAYECIGGMGYGNQVVMTGGPVPPGQPLPAGPAWYSWQPDPVCGGGSVVTNTPPCPFTPGSGNNYVYAGDQIITQCTSENLCLWNTADLSVRTYGYQPASPDDMWVVQPGPPSGYVTLVSVSGTNTADVPALMTAGCSDNGCGVQDQPAPPPGQIAENGWYQP